MPKSPPSIFPSWCTFFGHLCSLFSGTKSITLGKCALSGGVYQHPPNHVNCWNFSKKIEGISSTKVIVSRKRWGLCTPHWKWIDRKFVFFSSCSPQAHDSSPFCCTMQSRFENERRKNIDRRQKNVCGNNQKRGKYSSKRVAKIIDSLFFWVGNTQIYRWDGQWSLNSHALFSECKKRARKWNRG